MTLRASLDSTFLRKTSTSNQQIDVLDGLRGIAVLLVVLSHLSNLEVHAIPLFDFRGTGKYGVYLFFVLSAFLLTRPFVTADRQIAEWSVWRRYAIRRVLRIFPLYWLVLATNWFFTEIAPTQAFPTLSTELWKQHMWMQAGKGLYWTIPVEFEYYLVIPVFALAVRATRGSLWAITALVVAVIAASSWLWPASQTPQNSLNLGYYLPVFLIGSYAAVLDAHLPATRSPRFDALVVACFALVALSFASVAGTLLGEAPDKSWQHHNYIGFGIVWSTLLLATLRSREDGWITRALSSVPLRLVGIISFSIYLWHVPILRALYMLEIPSAFATAWIVIAASVSASMLSYVCIERPFLHGAIARKLLR
ncbi:MAG: acyltransferase [Myxococcota bacterium]|nr:acyltransferase [Myxococcota bacterium]